jgi:hypothetical protein
VIGVSRQQHILHEIDLDPVSLANRDRGGFCMKRLRMVVADCETLAAAPVENAWSPLVEMVPPPSSISLAIVATGTFNSRAIRAASKRPDSGLKGPGSGT